mmetsp:Transcript_20794/g.29896  ORF Transcript_20794/g.29896 Transcript_20794/m.29896 type:complete len:1152 (-) Transcript_20794:76-3531(-)|eukprot:CAMPEP_0185043970 /NCGR_PEP_ID=MMETSP1103-20130426/43195_1 /TAXON_ID=36769 /ORGANISM="Paraphysomonas bandaiensis, Strain Caron Lab Isolate" /LENGTH=1151 /DNA_ID=CAMNT_0027584199 /DNA_START=105 /DNA_END=3560 /DNA_ORIENTATION=+
MSSIERKRNDRLDDALSSAIEFASHNRKMLSSRNKQSKTEKEQQAKLKAIEKKLSHSKKLVVKHVMECRRMETVLAQTALTAEAIKTHVQTMQNRSDRPRRKLAKLQWLTETELSLLDRAGKMTPGTCSFLQRSLLVYSDDFLMKELEAFPLEQLGAMNVTLFSKVAWVSSGKRVSITEAERMFDLASSFTTLLLKRRPDMPFDLLRWQVLKRILRTALRLRYFALSLNSHQEELALSKARRTARAIRACSSVNKPESTINSARSSVDSQFKSSVGKFNVTEGNSLPMLLQSQLDNSMTRQEHISKKIKTSISLVSRTVPLGSIRAAHQYARRVGANKMCELIDRKIRGYYKIALGRLRQNTGIYRLGRIGASYMTLFGTFRMCRTFDHAVYSKVQRHFADWVEKLENLRELEEHAAVIEIQRVGRGAINRFNVRHRYEIAACRQIQRVVRGGLARILCRELAYQRKLKWAVWQVEAAWRKHRWQRTLKNLVILRIQSEATLVMQRVYRGHRGRKMARARRLMQRRHYGALKMQCLWRRYEATVLVDEYYSRWQQVDSSIKIQAIVRGRLGRLRATRMKKWVSSACTIQRGARCYIARNRVRHQRRFVHSVVIQRYWRGHRARLRTARKLLAKRKARELKHYAFECIVKVVRGYWVRRKWKPRIKVFMETRTEAATSIKTRYIAVKVGNVERRRIANLRSKAKVVVRTIQRFQQMRSEKARRARLEKASATKIQSLFRGGKGRLYAQEYAKQREKEMALKIPIYWRLRQMYYKDQNCFNGKSAIVIQCMFRRVLARRIAKDKRYLRAVRRVQYVARKYIERQRARDIVKEKKSAVYYRHRMAIRIQKVHRGTLGRKVATSHKAADMLKWFLKECKQCGLPKRCFLNFRVRKKHLERMAVAAIKIQALARGASARTRVRRIYKRLVRARDKRIHEKRLRSAAMIQSIVRMRNARKIVNMKREQFLERERKRKQLEELDNKLDSIHSSHLNDLLALRVQQGMRGKLARKEKGKRAHMSEKEAERKAREHLNHSATVIQAFARGVAGRERFRLIEQDLKKALKARAFCVECEVKVATKRCTDCKDQYCDECFASLHRKGKRKGHGWVSTRRGEQNVDNLGLDNPMLWQEFWDDNAQAKYWYHSVTGEATWICPF